MTDANEPDPARNDPAQADKTGAGNDATSTTPHAKVASPSAPGAEPARRKPGRPRGSKSHVQSAARPAKEPAPAVGERGKRFPEQEAMWLAEAWTAYNEHGPRPGDTGMWDAIAADLSATHGMHRTPSSLRGKWCVLAHDVQVYLTARREVLAAKRADQSRAELDAMAMELTRERNKFVGPDGAERPGPAFRYVAVANYLARFPKFGGPDAADVSGGAGVADVASAVGGASTDRAKAKSGTSSTANAADAADAGGARGTKRVAAAAVGDREADRSAKAGRREGAETGGGGATKGEIAGVSRRLDKICEVLEGIAGTLKERAQQERDFKLLQILPRYSEEYKTILDRLTGSQSPSGPKDNAGT